jgi:hypothetical protein
MMTLSGQLVSRLSIRHSGGSVIKSLSGDLVLLLLLSLFCASHKIKSILCNTLCVID